MLRDHFGTTLGDADLDGSVAFADFLSLSGHFGGAGGWNEGDMNCDRQVNFADFLLLSQNFTNPTAAASVPEPRGPMFAGVAVLCTLAWCRRNARHQHSRIAERPSHA